MTSAASNGGPILVLEGVTRSFGGLVAVSVERLEVRRHAITALIGPNGAGKTTLFNVLTGFDHADGGHWSFDGVDVSGWPAYRVARQGMVRTFQLTKALAGLTVLDNMLLGASGQSGERIILAPFRARWRAGQFRCTSSDRRGPVPRFRAPTIPTHPG